jgi:hypothetical protein
MKHLASIFWLSALALLSGCGGGETSDDPRSGPNITGNWQLNTTSTVLGTPPVAIAGGITQSGNSLNGAGHVEGSNCFDRLTTIGLTGTLTGSNVSLTSTPVDGQVIALTGGIANNALTGTYTISGGCANGDQGILNGFKVPGISGTWRIIFDVNEQHVGGGSAVLTQGSASSEGSFGVGGTVDNNDATTPLCYSGAITAGIFPSPSYIMGTSVSLETKANDGGTVVFLGTLNPASGEISGFHQVFGGICDGYFGGACLGRNLQASCHVPF